MSQELANHLLQHFTSAFLQGLSTRNPVVLEALSRAHFQIAGTSCPLALNINLATLFDALCISAAAHDLPVKFGDWDSDFKQFCQRLMHPWPDSAVAAAGYSIKLNHRSSSHATTTIWLLPNNSFKPTPFRGAA